MQLWLHIHELNIGHRMFLEHMHVFQSLLLILDFKKDIIRRDWLLSTRPYSASPSGRHLLARMNRHES